MSATHSSSMAEDSLMNSCVSAAVKVWMALPRSVALLRPMGSLPCWVLPSQALAARPELASMTFFRSGARPS